MPPYQKALTETQAFLEVWWSSALPHSHFPLPFLCVCIWGFHLGSRSVKIFQGTVPAIFPAYSIVEVAGLVGNSALVRLIAQLHRFRRGWFEFREASAVQKPIWIALLNMLRVSHWLKPALLLFPFPHCIGWSLNRPKEGNDQAMEKDFCFHYPFGEWKGWDVIKRLHAVQVFRRLELEGWFPVTCFSPVAWI